MKTFYWLLANSLIAGVTNSFVWFVVTFWLYLETKSVLATSYLAGLYLVATACSSILFGSMVDHHKKKTALIISSIATLIFFIAGLVFYLVTPEESFSYVHSLQLWILVFLLMGGVIAGNIRNITLPTTVTILVSEKDRDKANGLSGSMMGIAFSITSFASGLVLGFWGIQSALIIAVIMTAVALVHVYTISIPEKDIVHIEGQPKLDIRGTIKTIQGVPGLFALIF
nr:MFS transporter [Candidatus Woesebacteria bacterium]